MKKAPEILRLAQAATSDVHIASKVYDLLGRHLKSIP